MSYIHIQPLQLIYCLGPRIGSTVLAKCLQSSCKISYCYEPFNPDCHNAEFALSYTVHRYKNKIVAGKQNSFEESFKQITLSAKKNGWRFIKHIDPQLNDKDNIKLVQKCHKILYLYRENIFDLIVSRYLSVTQKQKTGKSFWNFDNDALITQNKNNMSKQRMKNYNAYCTLERPPIDESWLQKEFESFNHRHHAIKDMLANKNHITESYEKFYNDPSKRFIRIVDFLGFTMYNNTWKQFTRPENKISSPKIRQLIPNYNDLSKNFRQEMILS